MRMFKLTRDGNVELVRTLREPSPKQALERSIQKWEFIVAQLEKGNPINDDGSTTTCSLCSLYFEAHDCDGCPVYKLTGETGCSGTPYEVWSELTHNDTGLDLYVAKAEVNFLKALRRP